jgi:hypothetical protein
MMSIIFSLFNMNIITLFVSIVISIWFWVFSIYGMMAYFLGW